MDKRIALLGIDLQYDFCNSDGNLYVGGADKDVIRINSFIDKHIYAIDDIILSMDSHQPIHIAHQIYWKDQQGNHPVPFQTISRSDIANQIWIPQYNKDIALDYITQLEASGATCTIWPDHCIIGTKGWSLDETVFAAVKKWSICTGNNYTLINKGMYQATEHYSIFKAAVEYPTIENTLFNTTLAGHLKQFDQILIAGEAADFCVSNSLKDLLSYDPSIGKQIVMLTDCMSTIISENTKAKEIFDYAKNLGVRFATSNEISFSTQ